MFSGFCKKNSIRFLEKTVDSYHIEKYNFAVFFTEQSLQLMLKYATGEKFGEFPRTHNLKILFTLTESGALKKLYRENVDVVRELSLHTSHQDILMLVIQTK